jgi:cytidylate kinase
MPAEDEVPVIAVDGPAASSKGTVAAGVARTLGFHLLDSGALYRLVALKALQTGIPFAAEAPLAVVAAALDVRFEDGRIRLDGEDVTDAIRGEAVSAGASQVAVHPAARVPAPARPRRRRTRHGNGGVPGGDGQGLRDGQRRRARATQT